MCGRIGLVWVGGRVSRAKLSWMDGWVDDAGSSCRNANALLSLPTGTEIRGGDAVQAYVLDSSFGNFVGQVDDASAASLRHHHDQHQHQHQHHEPTTHGAASLTESKPAAKQFRAAVLTVSLRRLSRRFEAGRW